MLCKICASGDATYRPAQRQTLCEHCAADTPRKAGRESFDKRYWGARYKEVSEGTRREFYSDYLTSTCTVDEYIKQTVNVDLDQLLSD